MSKMKSINPRHLEFCKTPRQKQLVDAVIEHGGNVAKACESVGMYESNAYRMLRGVLTDAAKVGYSPDHDMTRTTAPGFALKGTSTLYDKDGNQALQWVKTSRDAEQQEAAMLAAVRALSEEIPRVQPLACTEHDLSPELCNLYTLSDCHVGMLAWHRENLDSDWDLSIAEQTLVGAFTAMMQNSPAAETAVICQLGDFLHFDGLTAITPSSGHALDADGRFGKIVEASVRILRNVIDQALARHARVHVVMAEGNHDIASSVWLRKLFKALYENEPRLTVDDSELPYYIYTHGDTMLAFHHGHLSKNSQLPLLFAAQFPAAWGATKFRYAHTGHRHHTEIKEHSGLVVTQHSTIASRDAYASRGGWQSLRQVTGYTYHKKFGQVASCTVSPEMIAAAAG